MQNLKKRNTCWRKKFQDRVVKTKEMGANKWSNSFKCYAGRQSDMVQKC